MCNFCHYAHPEEKFQEMKSFDDRKKVMRTLKGALSSADSKRPPGQTCTQEIQQNADGDKIHYAGTWVYETNFFDQGSFKIVEQRQCLLVQKGQATGILIEDSGWLSADIVFGCECLGQIRLRRFPGYVGALEFQTRSQQETEWCPSLVAKLATPPGSSKSNSTDNEGLQTGSSSSVGGILKNSIRNMDGHGLRTGGAHSVGEILKTGSSRTVGQNFGAVVPPARGSCEDITRVLLAEAAEMGCMTPAHGSRDVLPLSQSG
jgi:hypothetical protein